MKPKKKSTSFYWNTHTLKRLSISGAEEGIKLNTTIHAVNQWADATLTGCLSPLRVAFPLTGCFPPHGLLSPSRVALPSHADTTLTGCLPNARIKTVLKGQSLCTPNLHPILTLTLTLTPTRNIFYEIEARNLIIYSICSDIYEKYDIKLAIILCIVGFDIYILIL